MSRAESSVAPHRRRALVGLASLVVAAWVVLGTSSSSGQANDPAAGSAADASVASASSADWRAARADHAWSFPRDHFAHPEYRIEWWYVTGHLSEAPTRQSATQLQATVERPRFAYQLTFFRIGLTPKPVPLASEWNAASLLMAHAAITDLATGEHRYSEVLYRASDLLAGFGSPSEPTIAWTRAPAGTDARWELRWNGRAFDFVMRDERLGFGFELTTSPRKPLVFQGPDGLSRKSDDPAAASLYYSFTRLRTQGRVTLDRVDRPVVGESWMDHEISSGQLTADQVGWDWFSLQLSDGREVMLYELRDAAGRATHGRGSLVSPDGEVRFLTQEDWQLRATRRWRSEASGIEYPAGWSLELTPAPGETAEPERWLVEPEVTDQENRSSLAASPIYWEGAVTIRDVTGRRVGRGFVELTGYGEGNRPPL